MAGKRDTGKNEPLARDMPYKGRSQPARAREANEETATEKLEHDIRGNQGLGTVARQGHAPSETERSLERASGGNDDAAATESRRTSAQGPTDAEENSADGAPAAGTVESGKIKRLDKSVDADGFLEDPDDKTSAER